MEQKHPDKYAVDDNDKVVGIMPIEEIIEKGLNRRASRVYVFNRSGKILIQKRSQYIMKPLKYDPSMGGHVEVGESYLEAAGRELREELGIDVEEYTLTEVCEKYPAGGFFSALYKITVPDDTVINFDPEEVDSVYWLTSEELDRLISEKRDDCTQSLIHTWSSFRDKLVSI